MNLDFYCERLTEDFWAEPLNAFSNFLFFYVGATGFWRNRGKTWGYSKILSVLSILVGLGSFSFHTFANRITHLFDLLPIFIFTLIFVFFSFRSVLKLENKISWLFSILFVFLMAAIEIYVPKSFLNGSLLYFPPLVTLFLIGLKAHRPYLIVSGVFALSLIARTLDNSICEWLPIGTHFIWHLLNGICLAQMISITEQSNFSFSSIHRG